MIKVTVKFYYLATGMEGIAEEEHYTVKANSEEEALEQVIDTHYPTDDLRTRNWIKGCLSIVRKEHCND